VVREVAITMADGDRSVMTIEPMRATPPAPTERRPRAGRVGQRAALTRRRAMQPTPSADRSTSPRPSRRALWIWLAFVAVAALITAKSRYVADLSAFLPSAPTAEQAVLLDQVRSGVAARLLLIGIEGGDADSRADASRQLAKAMREAAASRRSTTATTASSRRAAGSCSSTATC
jgi:hypothetical protein